MALWDWTLKTYDKPGVPQACLDLQDQYGQNTSFLLWAVWAGGPDKASLASGAQTARDWEQKVLAPLRAVRRILKPAFPGIGDPAREVLRSQVKATELLAERVLMESLEGLKVEPGSATPIVALKAAVKTWGTPIPEAALATLAKALA